MCEAIEIFVRYETPDENGVTRRERNEQFGVSSPLLYIPEAGEHIWNWYWEISKNSKRISEGVCKPLAWSEIAGWLQITGAIVNDEEMKILLEMDASFCAETNRELNDYRVRREEKFKSDNPAKRKRR